MTDLPIGTLLFDNVSKRYRLGASASLRDAVANLTKRAPEGEDRVLWAVRNLSFRAEPGEALALVGPNGAGKTTTLKLLSHVTRPTSGRIEVSGRLSSLIELGAGFHPELTGRENIYLNGAILGLKRAEISARFDDIVAFSELERFIDTPVKRYSSGMYVRLAFAVAAHVQPEVLLVDEVLAVGDAVFRHRCIERMQQLQRGGTTIVFVSHNMHLVRTMCKRAVLLRKGQIYAEGPTDEVIVEYEKLILGLTPDATQQATQPDQFQAAATDSVLLKISMESEESGETEILRSDAPALLKIHYRTRIPQNIGRIDIRVMREDGVVCTAIDNRYAIQEDGRFGHIDSSGVFLVRFSPLQYTTGRYYVLVRITDPSDAAVIASGRTDMFGVQSVSGPTPPGIFIPTTSWGHAEAYAVETVAQDIG